MNKTKVLIFPAGAENALEIYDALKDHIDIDVYGASGKADYASCLYPSDHYAEGEFYIETAGFLEYFNDFLDRWSIDIVIPTHDEVALYFARNRRLIQAAILLAPLETAEICREKRKTFQLFSDCNFCPTIWDTADILPETAYPVFSKPNIGVGARNTFLINTPSELQSALKKSANQQMIICEYLPGDECTVDCYTNSNRELLFAGARIRNRIEHGIAYRSTTFAITEEIKEIAKTINGRLHFFGAWYFQVKRDYAQKWKLLEVSCRQSGGMTLYRHKGINFPLMGIYELNGIPVDALEMPGEWMFERRLMTRFKLPYQFNTVYIDLDDTLILNGNVNTTIMSFLYQCVNEKKEIILLTRHMAKPSSTLSKYKIDTTLFDRIVHITFHDEKATYIRDKNAIFIDNSFAERKKVHEATGIPTFDVDDVDCLLYF